MDSAPSMPEPGLLAGALLANTLLDALSIVSTPLPPSLSPPPLPPGLAGLTASLLEAVSLGLPIDQLAQLVGQAADQLDAAQESDQRLLFPAPVLQDALAVLIPGL